MSIYKRTALRWNDPLFNPVTVVSDCHADFATEIDIGCDVVAGEGGYIVPTEENVHHRLTDMRTNRILVKSVQSRQDRMSHSVCRISLCGQMHGRRFLPHDSQDPILAYS